MVKASVPVPLTLPTLPLHGRGQTQTGVSVSGRRPAHGSAIALPGLGPFGRSTLSR